MLWLINIMATIMAGSIFYEYIISDDDTAMKEYSSHQGNIPTGAVTIGRHPSNEIPVPK